MDITNISSYSGLISLGLTVLISVMTATFVARSGAGQATSSLQQEAISAMQSEISVLRGRVEDVKRENIRLEQVIETICSALKIHGLIITIQGEMVTVSDITSSKSTSVRTRKDGGDHVVQT